VFCRIEISSKIAMLEGELAQINDLDIQDWTQSSLLKAPDYFWTAPASSTGKYHPACANVKGGLVVHVKRVVWLATKTCLGWGICAHERDVVLSACLLHDIAKAPSYGGSFHDYENHPINARKLFAEEKSKFVEEIDLCVRYHMGKWTPRSIAKPMEDFSLLELAVYTSDFLATQKDLATPRDGGK